MMYLHERNIHEAMPAICRLLEKFGKRIESEKTSILRLDGPLSLELEEPRERVNFHREIRLNPFAFFFAALHMLVTNMKGIQQFGKQFREDKTGAVLEVNVNDTYVTLQRTDQGIDALIACRSSNPIQDTIIVSTMQEMLAYLADCGVGSLWWVSQNVHIDLTKAEETSRKLAEKCEQGSPYSAKVDEVEPFALIDIPVNRWLREADTFAKLQHRGSYADLFFSNVVVPMHQAGISLQNQQFGLAQTQLDACFASDWRKACTAWVIGESLRTPE